MCGIVGYVGNKKASEIIVNSLFRLEYRGYDSAGLAVLNKDRIEIVKEKGRIKRIQEKARDLEGNIGIGHTRWATHGKPTRENAHPHKCGKYAIVHNGIIENFKEIKDQLLKEGYVFSSETDSEVIAALLNYCETGSFIDTVIKAVKQLRGSFAVAILCESYPDTIILVRESSPLIIGKGNNEFFFASDVRALSNYTNTVFHLADGEFCKLTATKAEFFDIHKNKIDKTEVVLNKDSFLSKKNCRDYMLKEIYEIPEAIKNTINYLKDNKLPEYLIKKIKTIKKIYLIGCGTAYNSCLIGKYIIEKYSEICVFAEVASEFRYKNTFLNDKDLLISVSQSGETADTIACVKKAKKEKAFVLTITNTIYSSIEEFSDYVIYTKAGEEVAVAATKSYNCQLIVLFYLAQLITNKFFGLGELLDNPIINNEESIKTIAEIIKDKNEVFFLGRGVDYYLAIEAALKLKEVSYINCTAYPAGELKHGTLALIEQGSIAIFIITEKDLLDKYLNAIYEVKSRGAKVIVFTDRRNELKEECIDVIYELVTSNEDLKPVEAIIPLQLLAYYTAGLRHCDVDKPRNLAKSVTVE